MHACMYVRLLELHFLDNHSGRRRLIHRSLHQKYPLLSLTPTTGNSASYSFRSHHQNPRLPLSRNTTRTRTNILAPARAHKTTSTVGFTCSSH